MRAVPLTRVDWRGGYAGVSCRLTDGDWERLARALFEAQERMLPEGETWDEIGHSGRAHYHNSVVAVMEEFDKFCSCG